MRPLLLLPATILLLTWLNPAAAEPRVDPDQLPRIAPLEPEQALATFQLQPGYRLELVASEPLVADPIAIAFDENGRMYAVEMRGYSERREDRLGRIRLLEDTNGDGRFDQSTVFAEDLPWPTAVTCFDGGVFVGVTPDILYLKDSTGDGRADIREVAFTGFGNLAARLNVQQLPNSFTWTLDNRIHGALGGNPSRIGAPGQSGELELRGRDFSFDPRDRVLSAESGGGQYGLTFNDTGEKFVCSNSRHIQMIWLENRHAARNPFFAPPSPIVDIAADGPAAEVFRISPDEPWRVIRTQWRLAGTVSGPIEGGGRPSGYFTGATGLTIYRGNALPEQDQGDAFIADVGSNLVHRKKLRPDGLTYIAERPPDEQKIEFLASTDLWFRPVQFANAPDGALYIIDMYREVVEHPWSLPEPIKSHLDLNSGHDRGRIYRVVCENFQQPNLPRLGKLGLNDLVHTLEHPNGWHRDTAARLLYERQDRSAIPPLERLLARSPHPLARMHALYALDGLRALTPKSLLSALADPDERVRMHAVRLTDQKLSAADPRFEHPDRARLKEQVIELARDPSIGVRFQAAFAANAAPLSSKPEALEQIIRQDLDNRRIQAAVLSSLSDGTAELFDRLALDSGIQESIAGQEFLRALARLTGARNQSAEVTRILDSTVQLSETTLALSILQGLGEGLRQAGRSLEQLGLEQRFQNLVDQAAAIARNHSAPPQNRLRAIQVLGQTNPESELLVKFLDSSEPQEIQLAALSALSRTGLPAVQRKLIEQWPAFSPRVRHASAEFLLARPDRIESLLDALEENNIPRSDLAADQIHFLRAHRDQAIRRRALDLLGPPPSTERQIVVNRYLPALNLQGRAELGQIIYTERCASCHKFGQAGYPLGPDLAAVRSAGKEKLLGDIIDPNREVPPNYVSYQIETDDGEVLSGIIAAETPASVTLRQAFGLEHALPRSSIRAIRTLDQSIMPDGLEEGLTQQDMADLLEFLLSAEP